MIGVFGYFNFIFVVNVIVNGNLFYKLNIL